MNFGIEILEKDKYIRTGLHKRDDVVALRNYVRESFKDIIFKEDTHQYFLNRRELTPASTVCERFKTPFNKEERAEGCFRKYFNDEKSIYYGMTTEEILRAWEVNTKNACNLGTEKHQFGECVFALLTEDYDNIKTPLTNGNLVPRCEMENNIIKFWNMLPDNYIPILSECRGYYEELGFSGTFDNLFAIDGRGKLSQNLLLTDYKSNKNLFNQFRDEMLLPPFDDLPAHNLNIYTIQLSLYQLFLEKIKLKVIGRRVIWIRGGNPTIHKTDDVTKKLKKVLQ